MGSLQQQRHLFCCLGIGQRKAVQGQKGSSAVLSVRPTPAGPSGGFHVHGPRQGKEERAKGARSPSCCRTRPRSGTNHFGSQTRWSPPPAWGQRNHWASSRVSCCNSGVLTFKDRRTDSKRQRAVCLRHRLKPVLPFYKRPNRYSI